MSIENPGSLIDYANCNGLEPSHAFLAYCEATEAYREQLAREKGVSLDELHEGIGSLAVSTGVAENETANQMAEV